MQPSAKQSVIISHHVCYGETYESCGGSSRLGERVVHVSPRVSNRLSGFRERSVTHCSGLTPRRIVTQYQGIKRRSRSVFQTTPGQARNGYQQGSYHPRGRKLLESRPGTAVRQLSTNLASFRATYTNMVDTSSSAVPNSQDTANKMAYDDCNHCGVPNEATCNHGTANTPCRSTYTSQSVIAFLRGG